MEYVEYICACGYTEYDESVGDEYNALEPGTKWADVPADFLCFICGLGKGAFRRKFKLEHKGKLSQFLHTSSILQKQQYCDII